MHVIPALYPESEWSFATHCAFTSPALPYCCCQPDAPHLEAETSIPEEDGRGVSMLAFSSVAPLSRTTHTHSDETEDGAPLCYCCYLRHID